MTDLYLKANTRAALVKALTAAGLMVDDAPAQGVSLDEIGEIEGVTGYHANVRLTVEPTKEQITALSSIVVPAPETPYRVWA
jgi:hypothetical protein